MGARGVEMWQEALWQCDAWLRETAMAAQAPALASTLVAITQFIEQPSPEVAQRIVCQLDCASEDESCDAATRAICALLARSWLYGSEAACGFRPLRESRADLISLM